MAGSTVIHAVFMLRLHLMNLLASYAGDFCQATSCNVVALNETAGFLRARRIQHNAC